MKKFKESRPMKHKQHQVVKQVPKAYSLTLKRKHQQVSSLQKKRNLPNRMLLSNYLLK